MKTVSLVVLSILLVASIASAARLTIPPVGRVIYDVVPMRGFAPSAINNRGEVAGIGDFPGLPRSSIRPAIWHKGQFILINPNPRYVGAIDINDAGTALVNYSWYPQFGYCLIRRNGKIRDIDVPDRSIINALNNAGQVVGEEAWNAASHTRRGFIWQDGQTTFITDASQGICKMIDVNNVGEAVGFFKGRVIYGFPFRWKDGQLSYLELPEGTVGEPTAINDNGWVSGFICPNRYGEWTPVVWTPENHIIQLSPLRGQALDLNNRGDIVGWVDHKEGSTLFGYLGTILLWRPDGKTIDIEQHLSLPLKIQWNFLRINNRGQIICFGWESADRHGSYLLEPRKR